MNKLYLVCASLGDDRDGDWDMPLAVFSGREAAEKWINEHPENNPEPYSPCLYVSDVHLDPPPARELYLKDCPNGCGPMGEPGKSGAQCPVCGFSESFPVSLPEERTIAEGNKAKEEP